jgi:hypothetical protein
MPLKGWPVKEILSANLSGSLKGIRLYHALLGLSQASDLVGGFGCCVGRGRQFLSLHPAGTVAVHELFNI